MSDASPFVGFCFKISGTIAPEKYDSHKFVEVRKAAESIVSRLLENDLSRSSKAQR